MNVKSSAWCEKAKLQIAPGNKHAGALHDTLELNHNCYIPKISNIKNTSNLE